MVAIAFLGPLLSSLKGPAALKAAGAGTAAIWGIAAHGAGEAAAHTTAEQVGEHGSHHTTDHAHDEHGGHEDHEHEHEHEEKEELSDTEDHEEGPEEPEDAEELEIAARSAATASGDPITGDRLGVSRETRRGGCHTVEHVLLAVAAAAAAASATSRMVEGRCRDLGVVPWVATSSVPPPLARRRRGVEKVTAERHSLGAVL
uniref:Uncharacterized protein n=1 Tax=Alexandrium andersonii TaxID=327968 RepID=A0A7S2MWL3_9DINO|mmetsp:Transcript_77529/g.173521  ORF Transcript_77529/g.173521 Transcript_77529/m.173521 type:complete len:202 (+) Transcript_77529:103-708(+)